MADITVQRGIVSFSTGATTVTLTAGVDYTAPSSAAKAFCHITATRPTSITSGTFAPSADNCCISIDDSAITTQIVFTRTGTDTSRLPRIDWEIVEYVGAAGGKHEFVVRGRGVTSFGTTVNSVTTSPISGVVTDADILPWLTGSQGGATWNHANVTFRTTWNSLTDDITIQRDRTDSTAAVASWAAIEFIGSAWTVAVYDQALLAGSQTQTITSVGDVSRALLHVQMWGRGDGGVLRNSTAEVYLSATDTITYITDTSFAGTTLAARTWVLSNSQTGMGAMSVQRFSGTETARNGTFTVTVPTVALADTSVMEMSVRCSNTSNFRMPRDVVSWRLTGTTTLTGYQINNDAGTTADYRVALVTWPATVSRSNAGLNAGLLY